MVRVTNMEMMMIVMKLNRVEEVWMKWVEVGKGEVRASVRSSAVLVAGYST